jgi:aspartate racemase
VLIPEEADRAAIHAVIFEELCHGQVREESRRRFERAIDGLQERGAEGVILGCTEIMLLISPENSVLPAFDTTTIHAERAVELALA